MLVREEPFLFKPGEYYALVAAAGAALFCLLVAQLEWAPTLAALVAIAATFALRVVSHRLGWRTRPARTDPHPDV